MNTGLIQYKALGTPCTALSESLILDFVGWIDRTPKTTRTYITNLKQFFAWLKYTGLDTPCREDIVRYRDWLSSEHVAIQLDVYSPLGWSYRKKPNGKEYSISCKPVTVSQYIGSVKQFFAWTEERGIYPNISTNIHTPKIKGGIHKKEALTPRDVLNIENNIKQTAAFKLEKLEDTAKDKEGKKQRTQEQSRRLYAMYLLAVTAGLRTVELSRANIQDLEIINGKPFLYVWGKGHTEPDQKKPLAKEVHQAIEEYILSRTDSPKGNSPLFVSTGNRSKGKRIAPTTISTMLKTAFKEAGYNSDRITAHSLRHTAGTTVQEISKDIYTTQKYMRHSNPATTEIYLHIDTEKKEEFIAQEVYNLYHNSQETRKTKLDALLQQLSPSQIEQLSTIAEILKNGSN